MTFLLGPIAAVLSVGIAYKIFVAAVILASGILTALLFRSRLGTQGAIAAGLMYALSPWLLRTVFSEGNMPVSLFAALLPVSMWLMLRLYTRPTAGNFAMFAVISALGILAHPLLGLMFFFAGGASLLIVSLRDPIRRLGSAIIVAAAMLLGTGLASFWLLPAILPLDFPDTPNRGAASRIFTYSRDWNIFDIGARSDLLEAYIGTGLVALGIVGFLLSRKSGTARILFAVSVISVAFAFGMNNPVISKFGSLQLFIFFERFLLIGSFALAVLGGYAVKGLVSRAKPELKALAVLVAMSAVFGIIFVDNSPYFKQVRNTDLAVWVDTTATLDAAAPPGRFADFVGRPELSYFPPLVGRPVVFGWSIESTPHAEFVNLLTESIRNGHWRFTRRQLQQWWAAGAYALPGNPNLDTALSESGFTPGEPYAGLPVVLWTRNEPAPLALSQRRNSFVVGKAARGALVIFPWLGIPEDDDLSQISTGVLDDSELVVLAEVTQNLPTAIDGALSGFLNRGGSILALLSADASLWRADLNARLVEFEETMTLIDKTGVALREPTQAGRFGSASAPWKAMVIDDERAETLLAVRDTDGNEYPILSRFRVGSGAIYLSGGSMHIHAFGTGVTVVAEAVEAILSAEIPDLYVEDTLPALDTGTMRIEGGEIDLEINAGTEGGPVLLSVTAGPHWSSITVDGRNAEATAYEGLILLDLPPGNHVISLRQSATKAMWMGRALTLAAIAALLAAVYWWRRIQVSEEDAAAILAKLGGAVFGGIDRLLDSALGGIFGDPPLESKPGSGGEPDATSDTERETGERETGHADPEAQDRTGSNSR
ncbi:MAG: hypothetical protein IIC93_04175 [Chloroflexi bacterium]|nr:hypothetical protein [Chloroflexota bacterium]